MQRYAMSNIGLSWQATPHSSLGRLPLWLSTTLRAGGLSCGYRVVVLSVATDSVISRFRYATFHG